MDAEGDQSDFVEIQQNAPFANIAGFDAFITLRQNNNNISDFQSLYGCPGYDGGSLIRYQATTYCGLLVFAASPQCNPQGVPTTTCRSSVQAFIDSVRTVFGNASVCSSAPTTEQDAARTSLLNAVSQFAQTLPEDDPSSGSLPTQACIMANSDVPGELNACGMYDEAAALTFCNANPRQFCCNSVPNFTAPASISTTTTTTASTSSSTTAGITSTTTTTTTSRRITSTTTRTTSAAALPTQPLTTDTATVQSSNASNGSSDQTILGLSLPVFIGALVGGTVLLIAIIVGVVLCTRRRSVRSRQAQYGAGASGLARAPTPDKEGMGTFNSPPVNAQRGYESDMQSSGGGYSQNAYGGGYGAQQQQPPMPQQPRSPMPASPLPPMSSAAAGGGAAMAAMAVGAVVVAAAASSGPNPLPGQDPNGETMEAVINYVPNLSDEIYLYVGDPVLVKCQFNDGWGYGLNLTTQQEGAFPLACVAPYQPLANGQRMTLGGEPVFMDAGMDAEQEPGRAGKGSGDPARASFNIRQRQSSMFGPPAGFRETMGTELGR
ncbi:hypothetical protein HDU96_002566 [Phlyctochytrium bullatum]|nr:hypothetical protein HDU96_002566 [Phlyctochytrium bullatum]